MNRHQRRRTAALQRRDPIVRSQPRRCIDASVILFEEQLALAQAAPGPSILIVTLVGYGAAGILGAVLATVAMLVPSGALVLVFARFWDRMQTSPWRWARPFRAVSWAAK